MDVAEAQLLKIGYMGISLEEVASEVGVSKAALYYHFPGPKRSCSSGSVTVPWRGCVRGWSARWPAPRTGRESCGRSPDG
jgi:hypothetical protein